MANEIKIWNKVMSAALKFPGVAVDREKFLRGALKKHCCEAHIQDAISKGTAGVVPSKVLDKIAADCIKSHTKKVTILSAAMGVPGGWATLGTIPSDIAQFYYHVFVVAQKLAYIYGYPDMRDQNGHLSQGATNLLTMFVGVMTGVAVAAKTLQELGKKLQQQFIKKLPEYALSDGVLQMAVNKVAKKVGMQLSKNGVADGVSKIIPLVSGLISGALTYRSFKPQAERLSTTLHNTMLLLPQHSSATPTVEVDYQELPPDLPPDLPN